jgi:hypothetical protein
MKFFSLIYLIKDMNKKVVIWRKKIGMKIKGR